MNEVKDKRLTINISEQLKAKIKSHAAICCIPLGEFVNRTLNEKMDKIEKMKMKADQSKGE